MKLLKSILVLLPFVFIKNFQAQEIKNQSEIIKTFGKGDYNIVANAYSWGGVMNINDILPDKNQPNEHFEVVLQPFPNDAAESTRKKREQYFPDNLAFPVTYIKSNYEGNKKMQDKIGYVVRRGKYVGGNRIVFVGDYIFRINSWKNKDKYTLAQVLKIKGGATAEKTKKKKKKRGLGGFFKALKVGVKTGTGGGVSLEKTQKEILQPYLDKATAKQKEYYAKWVKNPENAKKEKYLKDLEMLMSKAIRNYNKAIMDSPEYKRIKENQAYWKKNDAIKAKTMVTIYNKTGKDIYVYEEGSNNSSRVTSSLGYIKVNCGSNYYYSFNSVSSNKTLCYKANSSCGSSVTVN